MRYRISMCMCSCSSESNFVDDESTLSKIKNAVLQMEKFLEIERKVRNEEIYAKVVVFGENLQPMLAPTIANILCQCFRLKFRHMTANLFAEIIFTLMKLCVPGMEESVIQDIIHRVDMHFSKKTKRSAHMVKNTMESLFNGWLKADLGIRKDLNGFTTRFLAFLSTFIQEIVYCN